jgi:hypothetical protein
VQPRLQLCSPGALRPGVRKRAQFLKINLARSRRGPKPKGKYPPRQQTADSTSDIVRAAPPAARELLYPAKTGAFPKDWPPPGGLCLLSCQALTGGLRVSSIVFCLLVALGWLWSGDTIKMRTLGIVALGAALGGCAGSPMETPLPGLRSSPSRTTPIAIPSVPRKERRNTVTQQRETKHDVVRGALLSQPDNSVAIINQRR